MTTRLPKNFQDLERFSPDWVLHSERDRNIFRVQQDLNTLQQYYDAVLPRLGDISAAVDAYDLRSLPQQYADLLALALMAMEVAPAVEYYDSPDVPDAVEYSRFEIYDTPKRYSIELSD